MSFYDTLHTITNITEIANPDYYQDVPDDWHIALCDVRGSTQAIENGKYKSVNAIAAASITALMNIDPEIGLPFVFGGDGATILIPPEILDEAGHSLLATRELAQSAFELDLRVGIIPVKDVLAAGYKIQVANLYVSKNFNQAVFIGGGLAYAERLLKQMKDHYAIKRDGPHEADFDHLECRWAAVRGRHEEIISLMVMATDRDESQVYQDVLDKIVKIYGDRDHRHPLSTGRMQLNTLPGAFRTEAAIRYQNTTLSRLLRMARNTLFARVMMFFNIGQWGEYKRFLVESTDHEKFDDTLRMTISGTIKQREMLRLYLETQRQRGRLVYGTQQATHALVTCIVFDYFGRQVHFVDGADGGYALAAKEMKIQLAERQQATAYPASVPE